MQWLLQEFEDAAKPAEACREWWLRPVDDSKAEPANVKSTDEIIRMAERVLALDEDEIPKGSLRHDTLLMLTRPVRIMREWRLWVVNGRIVTWSLYKEGSRVVYRNEIDDDALGFAQRMVDINPATEPHVLNKGSTNQR